MVKNFIRKMWFLILIILIAVLYFIFIIKYTPIKLITRYKDEINNSSYEYDDIIDDIKAIPIEIDTIVITCSGRDTIADIYNFNNKQKIETNYSLPSRFVKFMNKHLYYFPSSIVSFHEKKYIRFIFYNAVDPIKANGISIRMFYCDNDNKEGLKKDVYSGYNFKEIDDSSLDDVNDMKENWIYKIKENWYVIGVHLKPVK